MKTRRETMKKEALTIVAVVALMALVWLASSCKKEQEQVIVREHDTVYMKGNDVVKTDTIVRNDTIVITDTVFVSPPSIYGSWKCWKFEQFNGAILVSSDLHSNWNYLFEPSKLKQDFNGDMVYENSYNCSYGPNEAYVTVSYGSPTGNATYVVSYDSNTEGFVLTWDKGNGSKDVWYIKK
jgi:hypothetical protein